MVEANRCSQEAGFLLNQSLGNKIIKIRVSTTWNSDNKYYNKKDFPTLSPYMNEKYTLLNVVNNCANTSNQVYGMSFCIIKGYRVPSDYASICVVADTLYNQVLTLDFFVFKTLILSTINPVNTLTSCIFTEYYATKP